MKKVMVVLIIGELVICFVIFKFICFCVILILIDLLIVMFLLLVIFMENVSVLFWLIDGVLKFNVVVFVLIKVIFVFWVCC